MTDSYRDREQRFKKSDGSRDGGRGGRGAGNREGGGFRIRLSDNEMRSARALQEAFNLRSTVAVLGFAVRTLGQMLEEGTLETLVSEYKEQNNQRGNRRNDGDYSTRRGRHGNQNQSFTKAEPRPDPFARPEKPKPSSHQDEQGDNNQEELNTTNDTEPKAEEVLVSSEEPTNLEKEKTQEIDLEAEQSPSSEKPTQEGSSESDPDLEKPDQGDPKAVSTEG